MRRFLLIAAALSFSSTTASGQTRPQLRDGFMIGFGVGASSAGVSCDGCSGTSRQNGPSLYLMVGGAVSPSLILAGETHGWAKQENGENMQSGYLMGIAQWYPAVETGFFLKGGVGVGQLSDEATDPTFGSVKLESMGFAYQVGTGYDVRVGRNFSLTPFVNYLATAGASAKVNGASANERLDVNNVQYGLGFTWH
jgi:hypothetical protein